MKTDLGRPVWSALAIFLLGLVGGVAADGLNNIEVEFTGGISSLVVNGEGVGTVFIRLGDFDLRLIVNAKTEITNLNGDPIALDELKAEARVTIAGKYSASGILASRIRLDESPDNDFRVRGMIKNVETSGGQTLLTLLGIKVIVNADTKITDGSTASSISSLKPGLQVQIEGSITTAGWVAATIKVQSADKKREKVRFEGTVVSLTSSTLEVAVRGLPGNVTKVYLETKTQIVGNLAIDAPVYIIGTLNTDLTVTAREVRVLRAFEIKPDEKKLKVGEKATFILKLRETSAKDVPVTLKVGDASIASLSTSTVTIPSGGTTAEFVVTGGPKTGSTELTAEALEEKVTAQIKVGEVSEGENENHAGQAVIVFVPEHIKMGLNDTRDVVLLIKPPQKSAVTIDLKVSNGLLKIVSVHNLSNGISAFKVTIQSGDKTGSESVVATLPTELGGGKAELLVEVTVMNVDTSNKPKAEIDFRPTEIKLTVGESLETSLISSRSYDKDVTIVIAVEKGLGMVELPSTIVLTAGTKSVKLSVKGKSEGKATVAAAMPADLGGDTAHLNVQIGNK